MVRLRKKMCGIKIGYIRTIGTIRTHIQSFDINIISIFINVYTVMLVDGKVTGGEVKALDKFISAFQIERQTYNALREMLLVQNETGLFTDKAHPFNDPSYRLCIRLEEDDAKETSDPGMAARPAR